MKPLKQIEYIEGPKALENFKEGMKALFNVPKDSVVRVEKRKLRKRASSRAQRARKPRPSDKD